MSRKKTGRTVMLIILYVSSSPSQPYNKHLLSNPVSIVILWQN